MKEAHTYARTRLDCVLVTARELYVCTHTVYTMHTALYTPGARNTYTRTYTRAHVLCTLHVSGLGLTRRLPAFACVCVLTGRAERCGHQGCVH